MVDSWILESILDAFKQHYGVGEDLRVFRAPGRVNLIGEHTDYSLGFVLPVALDLATHVATAPSRDGMLRLYSEVRQQTREFRAADLPHLKPAKDWGDYTIGVAREVIAAGYPIEPANLYIRSTVPEGAGLSSSAALEIASALAFLRGRAIAGAELAQLGLRSEHNFVGIPCGIMDQYIAVFGREHAAVEIDCRQLTHRYVELPSGATFLAANTMVKHALAGSAYHDRVEECRQAIELLRPHYPEARTLRDISPEQLAAFAHELPAIIARRARHVVGENERVHAFVQASARGDLAAMGRLMVESHRSLQHDYEVSCEELDFLVDTALQIEGVFGSRMTGGGFGGCTVTMLRESAVDGFRTAISRAYGERFGIVPPIYPCRPSAGASEV